MTYRLYDLMIAPSRVHLTANYATDNYVTWDLSKLPGVRMPLEVCGDGIYELKATRPAGLISEQAMRPTHPEHQFDRYASDEAGPWCRVQWTEWGRMRRIPGFERVGMVNKVPVMASGAWLDRLPGNLYLEGHDSEHPLRIRCDTKFLAWNGQTATRTDTVGVVSSALPPYSEASFARLIVSGL